MSLRHCMQSMRIALCKAHGQLVLSGADIHLLLPYSFSLWVSSKIEVEKEEW